MTKVGVCRDAKGGWHPFAIPRELRRAVHDNLIGSGSRSLDVVNLRIQAETTGIRLNRFSR